MIESAGASDDGRIPEEPPAPEPAVDTSGRAGPAQALYFFGVMRARGWRSLRRRRETDVLHVRYRDLDALVRPTTFETPNADEPSLLDHQRVVERAMRRGTVLPAPYGIVFRGRRQLIRTLEDQYLVLDDGLAFLEGHWELRVHMDPANAADISEEALHLYMELRRHARAAVPFANDSGAMRGAAYLVERATWLDFMARAEELATSHTGLSLDITGPWPPYDFVRVTR